MNNGVLEREESCARTKLIKMIRSSGTPCSISTSTAFMAEPPVAKGDLDTKLMTFQILSDQALDQAKAHIATRCLEGTTQMRLAVYTDYV